MKVVIDSRPATDNNRNPTFIIRLYPETNADMGHMEWGIACGFKVKDMIRIVNGEFHYAICFEIDKP